MSESFQFKCPFCEQEMEVPSEAQGQVGKCPSCNEEIVPSEEKIVFAEEIAKDIPQSQNTKICPFCAEPILSAAIKCKHCGSSLNREKELAINKSESIGIVALFLPIGATFIAWGWIGSMPLIYDPMSKLNGLLVVTILLTAILMGVEANSVGAGTTNDKKANGKKRTGPIEWFLKGLLCWLVYFPVWMYYRSKYGLKNLCIGTILTIIIFVFVFFLLGYSIETQKAKIRRNLTNFQTQLENM
jgi:hypothetical protein